MATYRTVGLVVVVAAVAFAAGIQVGRGMGERAESPAVGPVEGGGEECCPPPPASARNVGPPPKIPTGSGLPCLVEFGSDECDACKRMEEVLTELTAVLRGKVDVVKVDTDKYPDEARRWRLRMIPTQIVVDGEGQELYRHEGYWSVEDVRAKLAELGLAGE